MNKELLVSVVVTAYNSEKTIDKCIKSICNQTYKNLEIIVINDGSKDHTLDKLVTLNQKDNRVSIINQTNKGQSQARNKGINMATGEYFLCVDSDDFLEESAIETLLKKLTKTKYDIIIFNFNYIKNTGEDLNHLMKRPIKYGEFSANSLLEMHFLDQIGPLGRNIFIRTTYFLNNKIEFPEGRTREDGATAYLILGCVNQALIIEECLYNYVQYPTSTTHSFNLNNFYDVLTNNDSTIKFVEANFMLLLNECNNYTTNNIFGEYKKVILNKNNIDKNELKKINNIMNEEISKVNLNKLNKKNKIKILLKKMRILNLVFLVNKPKI